MRSSPHLTDFNTKIIHTPLLVLELGLSTETTGAELLLLSHVKADKEEKEITSVTSNGPVMWPKSLDCECS